MDTPQPETRPISAPCDYCGAQLTGQMRPEDSGRMILISGHHLSPGGDLCRGTGRVIAVWSVQVELSAGGGGYALRVGPAPTVACASREDLIAKLRDLGIDKVEAQLRVIEVESGQSVTFEVPERRRHPRA